MLKRNITASGATAGEPDSLPVTAQNPNPSPFTDFPGLVRYLPMYGERTLRDLRKRGLIPSIRPPGSRKLAFHLPSVDAALLRFQRGGIEG